MLTKVIPQQLTAPAVRGWFCALVLVLRTVPASSAPSVSPLIEITAMETSDSVVSIEIRNQSGHALNVLDAKAWNPRNYLKIGLWETGLLGITIEASDAPPDLDGTLGAVRWFDRPEGVSEQLQPGETAALVLRIPPRSGLVRYHLVVLARSGEMFRTEVAPLPVLGRFRFVFGLLFVLFVTVEAWTMALRPRGTP